MTDWGADPPVGADCMRCHEPIRAGDRGGYLAEYGRDGCRPRPVHIECLQLSMVGHRYGVCGCTKYAGTSTIREAALELARRMRS